MKDQTEGSPVPLEMATVTSDAERQEDMAVSQQQNITEVVLESQKNNQMHPREGWEPWRWPVLLFGMMLVPVIVGYDVSNIANIQGSLYEAFGHVELLPWVAVGYTALCAAGSPLWRKLATFFPLKPAFLIAQSLTILGAIVAGAAPNMNAVIIGRAITGVASGGAMTLGTIYILLLSTPAEYARFAGLFGVSWAVGLILGPFCGGAFAQNVHATWRWAMYINIPVVGLGVLLLIFLLPAKKLDPNMALLSGLWDIDWMGFVLYAAFIVLFCMVFIFSGSTWPWNSGAAIAVWVIVGVLLFFLVAQQLRLIPTTKHERIFPVGLFREHRSVIPICLATCAVGGSYGIILYYTPLLFAFTRGFGPIDSAVRMLPFLCTFISATIISTGLLPVVRVYAPFYILAGIFIMAGTGAQTATNPMTSQSRILGLDALIGVGSGLIWQTGNGVLPRLVRDNPTLNEDDAEAAAMNEARKGRLRQDATMLYLVAQLVGVAATLAIAGCIFQNVGFRLLKEAIGGLGNFSDQELRDALAGVYSPLFSTDGTVNPAVLPLVISSVTTIIARLNWIPFAGGVVILFSGLCMKWEVLDFKA